MPKFIEGNLDAKGLTFGIVVSRFNSLSVNACWKVRLML